jgi:adenosine deaminase
MFPKIELHVHLEGTIRAGMLLQIARRNSVPLPAGSAARDCYQAGLRGALCDQHTRHELQQIGVAFDWAGLAVG